MRRAFTLQMQDKPGPSPEEWQQMWQKEHRPDRSEQPESASFSEISATPEAFLKKRLQEQAEKRSRQHDDRPEPAKPYDPYPLWPLIPMGLIVLAIHLFIRYY